MTEATERLDAAAERLHDYRAVSRKLDAARQELREAEAARSAAADALEQAERAAKRYHGRSLRALFAGLAGTVHERRAERRKALTRARQAHDSALARAGAARADVDALATRLRSLGPRADVERAYTAAFAAREAELVRGPRREEIIAAAERHGELSSVRRELDEALAAGSAARAALHQIRDTLDAARRAGVWDLVGFSFAGWVKRDRMSAAAQLAHHASAQLTRFRRELLDVGVGFGGPDRVDLGPQPWFADVFFDGWFDVTAQHRIHQAQDAVDDALNRVDRVLAALGERRRSVTAELAETAARRRDLVGG